MYIRNADENGPIPQTPGIPGKTVGDNQELREVLSGEDKKQSELTVEEHLDDLDKYPENPYEDTGEPDDKEESAKTENKKTNPESKKMTTWIKK